MNKKEKSELIRDALRRVYEGDTESTDLDSSSVWYVIAALESALQAKEKSEVEARR